MDMVKIYTIYFFPFLNLIFFNRFKKIELESNSLELVESVVLDKLADGILFLFFLKLILDLLLFDIGLVNSKFESLQKVTTLNQFSVSSSSASCEQISEGLTLTSSTDQELKKNITKTQELKNLSIVNKSKNKNIIQPFAENQQFSHSQNVNVIVENNSNISFGDIATTIGRFFIFFIFLFIIL